MAPVTWQNCPFNRYSVHFVGSFRIFLFSVSPFHGSRSRREECSRIGNPEQRLQWSKASPTAAAEQGNDLVLENSRNVMNFDEFASTLAKFADKCSKVRIGAGSSGELTA